MEIKEIINRNYQATYSRGLIKPETSKDEFIEKMIEEVSELVIEIDLPMKNEETESEELADIILVCFAYATHFEIDILSALENKVIFNEQRND